MPLSKEELAELAALEEDEQKQQQAADEAFQRQRLAAKRLRKKLAPEYGEHGKGFIVLMTTGGDNIAFRAPVDVELDALSEKSDDRAAQEDFLVSIAIEPKGMEFRALFVKYPGLVNSVVPEVLHQLVRATREEDVKK
jgi:hypothetical protein